MMSWKRLKWLKKIGCLLLSLLLLLLCSAVFAEEAVTGLQKDVVILFTSDVHCAVDQGWGYAGLYAMKEGLSAKNHVFLVDNGDAIQGEPIGTMSKGQSIIDIMNVVGYDAAIPGNHEFDFGVQNFIERASAANFPYLSCNLNRDGKLVFPAYVMKEVDGVKIGIVGLTTPTTPSTSSPSLFMNEEGTEFMYDFMQDETGDKLYTAVQKAVDDARAEGADYVIAVAHLGNEAGSSPWTYADVISHTSGIDALLDGHSHDTDQVVMKNRDGREVVRSGCGTQFSEIGSLTISRDGRISSKLFPWKQDISAPELLNLQNPAADAVHAESDELNQTLQEVVASSTADLVINDPVARMEDGSPVRIIRNAETNLGDLCADAYLNQAVDADIAFVAGGGIRASIEKGNVTLHEILRTLPFNDYLTVIRVTGQQILDALEYSVHPLPGPFGGFNQVAGMTFEVDPTIPTPCVIVGSMFHHVDETMERRVRNVVVGDRPLDPGAWYRLAGADNQLLEKGNGYTMFEGAEVLVKEGKLDNQLLIDYITGPLNGVIGEEYADPYGQGRIVVVNSAE